MTSRRARTKQIFFTCGLLLATVGGCSLPSISGVVSGLNRQTDLELVCDGAPSFLLMLDSLIESDPKDIDLRLNATKAYIAFTTIMPACGRPDRAAALGEKARKHALELLRAKTGIEPARSLTEISGILAASTKAEVEALFWGSYGWATWISLQQGAPAAVIDLPKVEIIMRRVLELDESFYYGGAHLFLGIYHSLKPPLLGGDPEASRKHFERAMQISGHRLLAVQLAYARNYARMVFDRELYETLLNEVLAFDIESAPEHTLTNLAARRQAGQLLTKIDEYF